MGRVMFLSVESIRGCMRRLIPILMLFSLFTLLPLHTAVADDTSMGGEVTIILGVEKEAPITTEVTVSDQATAVDDDGQALDIEPNGIFDLEIVDDKGTTTLPITLPEDKDLDYFKDEGTGLELTKTSFKVPVKDTEGNLTATITGDIDPTDPNAIVRNGVYDTKVIATNLLLTSEEFEVDLTSTDEKIGKVSASFQTTLHALPDGAALKASVSKEPDTETKAAFQLAVIDEGKRVSDIACTLSIERTKLDNLKDVSNAVITMKAGRAWVELHGIENIYIMRYPDEGESQKLPTDFLGYEEEDGKEIGVFRAVSPDGFSVFGLAATAELQGSIGWWLILSSISGSILVAGFLVGMIIRRRRQQESLLLVRWSTGMRSEDWKKWR